MDLQSNGGKPVTSENVPSIDNLRAHSPQTADVSRGQPDTSGRVHTLPLVAMEARICQLSPLRNDETMFVPGLRSLRACPSPFR